MAMLRGYGVAAVARSLGSGRLRPCPHMKLSARHRLSWTSVVGADSVNGATAARAPGLASGLSRSASSQDERTGATTVMLQISLTLGASAVALAMLTLVGKSANGGTLMLAAAFGAALPAGWIGGARLSARLWRRSPEHLRLVAGVCAVGVLATVISARIVYALGGSSSWMLLLGNATWAAVLATLVARGPRRPPVRTAHVCQVAAAVLVPLAVTALLPARLLAPGSLALSLIGGTAVVATVVVARRVRLPRRLGRVVDATALVLAALLVIDVASYLPHLPYDPHNTFGQAGVTVGQENLLLLLHHGFYLGPVNDVLHGRAALVDTYSQYGAGVLYFLAAFFKIAPLGYGPFALLASTLTALQYAAAYAILRMAGCGRALAVMAAALAVVATVFGTVGSFGDFPSIGGLRFGPSYAVMLAAVAAARWPKHARSLKWAQLVVLAGSSVWSVETFVCAAATFAALTGVSASAIGGPRRLRVRRWAADLLQAGLASVVAISLFTLLTVLFTGSPPHVLPYLEFFRTESLALLASPWAAGFGVGALYLASTAGVLTLVARGPRTGEVRPWLLAAAGATAFGTVSFVYWASRPIPLALPPLSLPAIMLGALWLHHLLHGPSRRPLPVRWGTVALAGWVTALLVIFAWPAVEKKWTRTAAWQILPGGPPLRDDLRMLWHSPVIDPRASEAEGLLRHHFPRTGPVVVLLEPDLMVETLLRSRRVNRLPLADILQDNLIRDTLLPRVARAVDRIPPGTPMLVQLRPDPAVNPFEQPTPLHRETMELIRRRFALKLITTSPSGLSVVRLVPHRGAGAAAQ